MATTSPARMTTMTRTTMSASMPLLQSAGPSLWRSAPAVSLSGGLLLPGRLEGRRKDSYQNSRGSDRDDNRRQQRGVEVGPDRPADEEDRGQDEAELPDLAEPDCELPGPGMEAGKASERV